MPRFLTLLAAVTLTQLTFSPASAGDIDPLSVAGIAGAAKQIPVQTVFGKEVVTFEPTWISTQLRDHGANRAAISLCGGPGLKSCDEAKRFLQALDAQCSTVLLAVIDLSAHPGVKPKEVLGTDDPELILFSTRSGEDVPEHVHLFGVQNPNMFALAMCPEESNALGPAIRSLRMMGTVGRQPR